jgi:hypothetical protein
MAVGVRSVDAETGFGRVDIADYHIFSRQAHLRATLIDWRNSNQLDAF